MLNSAMIDLLGVSLWETLYMVVISTILSYAVGLPIGVVLNITGKDGICRNRVINSILGVIVNIFRSIPFLILLIWMIPVTQAIVGTMVGPTSVIVPLVASAAPFVGRMVESSLSEIDGGVIEAAQSMGSSSWQIIYKVLIPEAKPSLLIGAAISVTTILGYSAMARHSGRRRPRSGGYQLRAVSLRQRDHAHNYRHNRRDRSDLSGDRNDHSEKIR